MPFGNRILVALASLACAASLAAAAPSIRSVAVAPGAVRVDLAGGDGKTLRLVEFDFWADAASPAAGKTVWTGPLGAAAAVVLEPKPGETEPLYRKFALFPTDGDAALTPQHFADDLTALPARKPPTDWPKSQKGVANPRSTQDLVDLGARHCHVNLLLDSLLAKGDADRDPAFSRDIDGRTVYLKKAAVETFDARVKELTDAGINVVVVVLNGLGDSPLHYPGTQTKKQGAIFGGFNVDDADGLRTLRALVGFLSERYTRPDARYGSVGGWIVGNEVNTHVGWHNLGRMTGPRVARHYVDELRAAYLATREAGADIPVFASMDHFWSMPHTLDPQQSLPGRELVDLMAKHSRAEGDFPWNLAHHPYPENLMNPRWWNDKTAVYDFNSPRITFKNLEVLTAYFERPEMRIGSDTGPTRRIILSEQGFNHPEGDDADAVQAAAFAAAFEKVRQLPGIAAFIYFNHVDQSDGFNPGLRGPNPDDPSDLYGKRRQIWHVFQAAETPRWNDATAFALPIIGWDSWAKDVPKPGPFPDSKGEQSLAGGAVNLMDTLGSAEVVDTLVSRPVLVSDPMGNSLNGWLQHPSTTTDRPSKITLSATLPAGKLVMRFATAFDAPTANGCEFAVLIDGKQVFAQKQETVALQWHEVDVSAYAGKTVKITFRVDGLGNTNYDSAEWAAPAVYPDATAK